MTAANETLSASAPPPTKPELASLVAEKATVSTPALPTTLKSVPDAAETVTEDGVITVTTANLATSELRDITGGASAGVVGTEDVVAGTTVNRRHHRRWKAGRPGKMSHYPYHLRSGCCEVPERQFA